MSPQSASPAGPDNSIARKRILVVEDELLIRFMLSDELRNAGHEVVEAISADEALAIFSTGVQVDLMISDVRMPGSIDGLALLSIVREMSPALPVIIISAHLEAEHATARGAACFVAKPFSMASLVHRVRDELEKVA